jgi:hypothetical protein
MPDQPGRDGVLTFMAWTKAKTAIFVVGSILMLAGIVALLLGLGDSRKRAQAKGERLIKGHVAVPIILTNSYNAPGLSMLPSGLQTFNNVPLQIGGMICLWGEGGASRGMVFPKAVLDVPVHETFQTLYLYHKASFGSPPGTPVCEVVFHYIDGASATNRLLYGDDVLDWFAPGGTRVKGPTGTNSKTAWIGQMTVQNGGIQQLRTCMTAIENPDPKVRVSSIDFLSCKSRTCVYIMAMTTGKTGLMNEEAAPIDDRKN